MVTRVQSFDTIMSVRNHRENFTDSDLRRMQAETGVDVYALLDLLELTPTERLRNAMANAHNLTRLRTATRRVTGTK